MYHVLRRQLTPRHSPSALVAFDLCCRELVASRVTFHDVVSTSATSSPMHDVSRHPHRCSFTLLFSSSYSLVKERAHRATLRVSPLLTLALSTTDETTRHSRRVAQTDRRLSLNSRYAVWRTVIFFKSFALGFVRVCFLCVLRTCGEF